MKNKDDDLLLHIGLRLVFLLVTLILFTIVLYSAGDSLKGFNSLKELTPLKQERELTADEIEVLERCAGIFFTADERSE